MSEYYYGKLGDRDWTLLSDKPIVVWTKKDGFSAFENISEADNHFQNPGPGPDQDIAYFGANGHWNEVNFFLEKGKTKIVKGFSP